MPDEIEIIEVADLDPVENPYLDMLATITDPVSSKTFKAPYAIIKDLLGFADMQATIGTLKNGISTAGANTTPYIGGNPPLTEIKAYWVTGGAGSYTHFPGSGGSPIVFNAVTDQMDRKQWLIVKQEGETFYRKVEAPLADLKDYSKKADVGIIAFTAGTNLLASIAGSDINDNTFWGDGYMGSGTAIGPSSNYRYTLKYMRIYPQHFSDCYLALEGNACAQVYDENLNIIQVLQNTTSSPIIYTSERDIVAGAMYFRTSHKKSIPVSNVKIMSPIDLTIKTSDVFVDKDYVIGSLGNYGLQKLPVGTNLLSRLNGLSLSDTTEFASGYYGATGSVGAHAAYWHGLKFIRVYPGIYDTNIYAAGNAKLLLYDEAYKLIAAINGPGNPSATTFGQVEFPAGTKYMLPTFYGSVLNLIQLKTKAVVYANTTETIQPPVPSGVAIKNTLKKACIVKTKFPIVSFIADDGNVAAYPWYIPAFDAAAVKSSFAIATGSVLAGNPDIFTPAQLKELLANGHDLVGHTRSHVHLATDMTLEQATEDIRLCKTDFMGMGIYLKDWHFVAPFGDRNVDVDRAIRQQWLTDFHTVPDSRVAAGTCCNVPPIDRYLINRVSFDAGANGVSRLALCKQAVDLAVTQKAWLVFAVHPQYPEYFQATNPTGYLQRRQELADLFTYIKSVGATILTASAGYEMYKNLVDIGNVNLDSTYYTIGMDGTEAGSFLG